MTTAQFQNLSVSPLALNDNCTVPEPLWMSTCLKWPLLLQVPNDITHSQLLPVFGHPIKSSAKRVSFSHRTWQQYLQQQKIQDRAQDQVFFTLGQRGWVWGVGQAEQFAFQCTCTSPAIWNSGLEVFQTDVSGVIMTLHLCLKLIQIAEGNNTASAWPKPFQPGTPGPGCSVGPIIPVLVIPILIIPVLIKLWSVKLFNANF